ncbi:MAG: hypothetical protein M1831_002191 [Alyxoria varia]|nr:MAG: hypothetical protein M1831_002191 [Alyxoria varia]
MDPSAATLLRSASRAFYQPELILILDAILLHSALSDDDLAHLMGQQRKALRRLSSKLVHDGIVTVTSRQEIKEGHTRPMSKDYYWVDTHQAIDVVKYRIKSMFKEVERRYGQKAEEKKEFRCGTCKSEYTQMEVLDSVGPSGFICKLCSSDLAPIVDDSVAGQAGHEVQSRMNAQLGIFESLMQKIDNTEIAENTFDRALENHLPVERDIVGGATAKSEAVKTGKLPPATVHGMKLEQEKVQLQILDDEGLKRQALEEEKQRKERDLRNQMPAWHTDSTVHVPDSNAASTTTANGKSGVHTDTSPAGAATATATGGADDVATKKEEATATKREEDADEQKLEPSQSQQTQEDPDDQKKPEVDNDELNNYFAAMAAEPNDSSADSDSDPDSSDDEDEDEDDGSDASSVDGAKEKSEKVADTPAYGAEDAGAERPAKKVRLSPASSANTGTPATTNGVADGVTPAAEESSEGDDSDN